MVWCREVMIDICIRSAIWSSGFLIGSSNSEESQLVMKSWRVTTCRFSILFVLISGLLDCKHALEAPVRATSLRVPGRLTGKQVAQTLVGLFRAIQQIHQRLVRAARDHEQSLIEQGLLCGQAGAVEDEVGQRLVGHLGGTAQHHLLLGGGAQPKSGGSGGRRRCNGSHGSTSFVRSIDAMLVQVTHIV